MKSSEKVEPDGNSMLLRASAKRLFESLMEQTPDRIYIKDKKGRFVATSDALAKMHGFEKRHQLEGLTDFDLFSKEHAQQAYDDEQEILKTEKPIINRLEKETWDDGSITWVSSSKAPLYLASGKLVGITGISRDVTAEREAQMKLAKSEQRLREQNDILQSDLESAHKVQSVMIPGRVPQVKYVDIAYLWKPMTSVGGDIVSFPRNPSNCLLFFLGDVCGHGVTAAFYTVLIKYLTAHSAEVYSDNPQDFLNSVNQQLCGRLNEGFVTGLAGHFGARQKNGNRKLVLSHAGHRQVLVYRKADKKCELVTLPGGTVMGIPGGSASKSKALKLQIGDRFYAFTDGIVEASDPDGEEFGMEQLIQCFEQHANKSVQEIQKIIYDEVAKYTGQENQQDDITMLAFELS